MTYRAKIQPHCLWCGKAIAKRTVRYSFSEPTWLEKHPPLDGEFWKTLGVTEEERPTDKAGCQRLTNLKVASIDYGSQPKGDFSLRRVFSFTAWDGVSYQDEFFCNGNDARYFAYAAARHGLRFKKKSAA